MYFIPPSIKGPILIVDGDIQEVDKFQKYSLFFKLRRSVVGKTSLCAIDYLKLKDYFLALEHTLKNLSITEPSYCFPGGHFGQLLHYYLDEESRGNIINFVDRDIMKWGKRIYRTNKYMIGLGQLKDCTMSIVANTPYSEEIIGCIRKLYGEVVIIKL